MAEKKFTSVHYEAIERGGSVLVDGEYVTSKERLDEMNHDVSDHAAKSKPGPKPKDD